MVVKEINLSEFSNLNGSKPILVEFGAEWCMPCKALDPLLNDISNEVNSIGFYRVDVDKESSLAQKFNVMTVPTMLILKEGKEIGRINGFQSKEQLKGKILSFVK